MKGKIKNYLLAKINFAIPLILLLLFCLWLVRSLGTEIFLETSSEIFYWVFTWKGWFILSPIALLITAVFMHEQASATKKMAELQWTPRVGVIMETGDPQLQHIKELEKEKEYQYIKELGKEYQRKMGTRFIFYNYTQAMVWIWIKVDLKINGKKISKAIFNKCLKGDASGENPFFIGAASMTHPLKKETATYPFLLKLGDISDKKITVTATLKYWSAYTPEKQKNPKIIGPIKHTFEKKGKEWVIPLWGLPSRYISE